MDNPFQPIKNFILGLLIFLFPFFFLPLTDEFFFTNKMYFLAFGILLLFFISNIEYLILKKISWFFLPLDGAVILFVLTTGSSILISSPNKIQAFLNPNFGLVTILSLTGLYFYLSRFSSSTTQLLNYSITISTFLLSLTTIIFFFQPFQKINLPNYFQFLKNPTFTPLGNQLDLAIFLGFFVVLGFSQILDKEIFSNKKNSIFYLLFSIFCLFSLSLTSYSLLKPASTNFNEIQRNSTILPPFRLSWYASVEILKNPLTALFGVGVDNFSSIFTKVKDIGYNQSPFWQISSFPFSRSTILHIFTETGLFGLISFSLLLTSIAQSLLMMNHLVLFTYFLLIFALFPPSLVSFFLFFLFLAYLGVSRQSSSYLASHPNTMVTPQKNNNLNTFNLSNFFSLYFSIAIISLLLIGTTGYLLGRSYAAELYFKKGLDGFAKNDIKQVYDNIRQAIILNPYIERFRLNFSQINLLIANNLASKKKERITEQDRQNISQAIQAAISEAKATVALNPKKAMNWENLATIYRNIINTVQGADLWAISAYQRAIIADPQNPLLRVNLGGIYYSLGRFDEAVKLFEEAIILKPDFTNAYYNLAWTNFKKGDYQRAVSEMKNVLTLINPKGDKADYEKAQKDLKEFEKKLSKEKEATPTGKTQTTQLTLPTPAPTLFDQKIKLPKGVSP